MAMSRVSDDIMDSCEVEMLEYADRLASLDDLAEFEREQAGESRRPVRVAILERRPCS